MAETILSPKIIKQYASIFAEVFKQQGIMSANSSTIGKTSSNETADKLNEFKLQKTKERLLKENNKLLDDFIEIQKNVNSTTGDSAAITKKRNKIESKLKSDSLLLGNSYVDAANSFKRGKMSEADIKSFAKNSSLSKLTENFNDDFLEASDTLVGTMVESADKISTKTGRLMESIFKNINPKILLGASFVAFSNEFRAALKYGTDMTSSFISREIDAIKMGVSPAQLVELEANHKRLVNGLGGAAAFEEDLASSSMSMFKVYGDLGEATKGTMHALHALSMAGIKPSTDLMVSQNGELSALNKSMFKIRSVTGKTFAEQNAAMEEYIKSDAIKAKLVTVGTSAERIAIIQRGLSNKEYITALGLTADQAERLAESFNSINGMNPKDRLKESYKAQAVMQSLGIAGAAEFGQVMRLGGLNAVGVTDEMRNAAIGAAEQLGVQNSAAHSGVISSTGLITSALVDMVPSIAGVIKDAQEIRLADKDAAKSAYENSNTELAALTTGTIAAVTNGFKYIDMAQSAITNTLLTGLLGTAGLIYSAIKLGVRNNRASRLGGPAGRTGRTGPGDFHGPTQPGGRPPGGGPANGPGRLTRTRDRIRGLRTSATNLAGTAGSRIRTAASAASATGIGGAAAAGLKGIGKIGGSALSLGSKVLGKLALPLLIAQTGYDAMKGWNNADKNFDTKNLTTGMKAASSLGGLVEGISFGLIDAASVAKGTYELLGDKPDSKAIDSKAKPTPVTPILDKKNQPVNIKAITTAAIASANIGTKDDGTLSVQQQMLVIQQSTSELITRTNELLSNNFELLHNSDTKKIKGNETLRMLLEEKMDNSFGFLDISDSSSAFV